MEPRFFRDASNRLTHDRADIDSLSYPSVCKKVAEHFNLKPTTDVFVGLDLMFWSFTDGDVIVELAWDNWFCFMVTAIAPDADILVREIATFLSEAVPPKLDS